MHEKNICQGKAIYCLERYVCNVTCSLSINVSTDASVCSLSINVSTDASVSQMYTTRKVAYV